MAGSAIKHTSNLPPSNLYEDDYAAWLGEQIGLLRSGRLAQIDAGNIAEELEGLSRSEFRALVGNLSVLIQHLLKWDYQPEQRSRSWLLTIREHRRRVLQNLEENPSFRTRLNEAVEDAHASGRNRALDETGLSDEGIPELCPYAFDALMTRDIALPETRT